jgi:hypothetical protein
MTASPCLTFSHSLLLFITSDGIMTGNINSPGQAKWVFVSTSPAARRLDKAQRTQMRRRVMRDIGYSRRKPKQSMKQKEESLQFRETNRDLSAGWEYISVHISLQTLPVGPIGLDLDSQHAFSHSRSLHQSVGIYSNLCIVFSDGLPSCLRIYRDKWYPMCSTDAAAFHQMLASYATHLLLWRQDATDRLNRFILSHHTRALTSVRGRLGNLEDERAVIGMLTAICALACHAHLSRDTSTWNIHMAAINRILHPKINLIERSYQCLLSLLQWYSSHPIYQLDLS